MYIFYNVNQWGIIIDFDNNMYVIIFATILITSDYQVLIKINTFTELKIFIKMIVEIRYNYIY